MRSSSPDPGFTPSLTLADANSVTLKRDNSAEISMPVYETVQSAHGVVLLARAQDLSAAAEVYVLNPQEGVCDWMVPWTSPGQYPVAANVYFTYFMFEVGISFMIDSPITFVNCARDQSYPSVNMRVLADGYF